MNQIAETQLRQLHQFWPNASWDLKRAPKTGAYAMVRYGAGAARVFVALTADEAIVRAHIDTMREWPLTPSGRRRRLRAVSGGFDDAA